MLCCVGEFACFIDIVVSGILVHVHVLHQVVYVLQRFGVMSDISAFCNDVPLRSAPFSCGFCVVGFNLHLFSVYSFKISFLPRAAL